MSLCANEDIHDPDLIVTPTSFGYAVVLMLGLESNNMDTLMVGNCPTWLVIASSELPWLTSAGWLCWCV